MKVRICVFLNSIRNKFCELKDLIATSSYDCVIVSETKIDDSFSTEQFVIPGYKIPYRADRNIYGGGLLVYIKKTLKSRRTDQFEEKRNR